MKLRRRVRGVERKEKGKGRRGGRRRRGIGRRRRLPYTPAYHQDVKFQQNSSWSPAAGLARSRSYLKKVYDEVLRGEGDQE